MREKNVDKGNASKMVFTKLLSDKLPDNAIIVLASGADTDKEMFKAFARSQNTVTFRVVAGASRVRWRVGSPVEIREVLRLFGTSLQG